MKVSQIMTADPGCCERNATAHKAANMMLELDVGVVPVVDNEQDKHLVGVVTDRDLCIGVIAAGKDPTAIRLEDCMSADVIFCAPEDDVERVVNLMNEHQVRRIPVIDHEKHVTGIVSMADVAVKLKAASEIGETIKHISEPDSYPHSDPH